MNKNNFITGKQLSRLGQVFTLVWGLTIFILCLMPASDLPEVRRFPNLDKIVHFTFYFVLTVSTFSTLLLLKKESGCDMIFNLVRRVAKDKGNHHFGA